MPDRYEAAIESIYESALDPSRLPHALQDIADYFGDIGASIVWTRDDGTVGTIAAPSVHGQQALYEKGGWNAQDLRVIRAIDRGYFFSGAPFTDRHLCSEEEMRSAPIYADFLLPLGIGWVAAVAVSPDPRLGVLLCVHRSFGLAAFSDAELSELSRFGNHVERSLRLGIHLFDSELLSSGLERALARLHIGVFALDSRGRVVFSNPMGDQLAGAGLHVVNQRLVTDSSSARSRLNNAISNALSESWTRNPHDLGPILIERSDETRPIALYVLPLAGSTTPFAELFGNARVIIFAMDPEASGAADPAVVRDLLGLTLGEARVAALVGAGVTPREAAETLGITEQTARWTLKQVYAKTGISRQSELVLLLSKMTLD